MRILVWILAPVLGHLLALIILGVPSIRARLSALVPLINFLLAQKFKLFGVMMGNGMMQQLSHIHPMDTMFAIMDGEIKRRLILLM
ncbi:hypothetical protein Leryth_017284 [Lithospermum erythrorhizon]|nr:hypothetical protein Leryth_017284 [Lithospermum erythrorhizon]